MTDSTALRALLGQVVAGTATGGPDALAVPREQSQLIAKAFGDDDEIWANFVAAHDGSLDAAKALHEATLPGWWWSIGTCNVSDDARVAPHDDSRAPDGGEWSEWTDVDVRPSGNPARAWVISILLALIEEAGNE